MVTMSMTPLWWLLVLQRQLGESIRLYIWKIGMGKLRLMDLGVLLSMSR